MQVGQGPGGAGLHVWTSFVDPGRVLDHVASLRRLLRCAVVAALRRCAGASLLLRCVVPSLRRGAENAETHDRAK